MCGISTWQVGQAEDISHTSCAITPPGQLGYTIYQIVNGQLIFGAVGVSGSSTDGTSDANRPTSLSTSLVYTKQ
jgi:hypothetical protein